ncbi:MAG: cysteine hydrolase family protein, partial [Actinobacteria bacterium]|nr:cysteine hydrolase family protein [Actinomycetota bacterium]
CFFKTFFTKTPPWKKEFLPENINTLYSDPSTSYYSEDNSGFSEKFYLVKPNPKDVIINKNNYDAFSETDLNRILKEKGVKYIVVTGVFTDGCVLATIIAGFSLGYNFVILKDLIETTDSKIRQELQEKLKEFTFPIMYGRTLISSDFIENWNL